LSGLLNNCPRIIEVSRIRIAVILNFSAPHASRPCSRHSGRPTPRRRPNGGKMPGHHQHPTTTLLGQTRVRYALLEFALHCYASEPLSVWHPSAEAQQGRPQHSRIPSNCAVTFWLPLYDDRKWQCKPQRKSSITLEVTDSFPNPMLQPTTGSWSCQ
jgi:hypothetical protein